MSYDKAVKNDGAGETYEQRRRGWAISTLRYLGWNTNDIKKCLNIPESMKIGDWLLYADNKTSMEPVNRLRAAFGEKQSEVKRCQR